jgi:hypothetical protein
MRRPNYSETYNVVCERAGIIPFRPALSMNAITLVVDNVGAVLFAGTMHKFSHTLSLLSTRLFCAVFVLIFMSSWTRGSSLCDNTDMAASPMHAFLGTANLQQN